MTLVSQHAPHKTKHSLSRQLYVAYAYMFALCIGMACVSVTEATAVCVKNKINTKVIAYIWICIVNEGVSCSSSSKLRN